MRKLITLAIAMFAWASASAQTVQSVNYYGVDFSKTKVFGATETEWEFKNVFGAINSLVISEWGKYNPGKFLYENIAVRDISPTVRVNSAIDPSEIIAASSDYGITDDDIAEMVRRYELQQEEGTGLVIIGTLLDKPYLMGGFVVVHFDVASRQVLSCVPISGKARGFGLRNYWAGALYSALRSVQ